MRTPLARIELAASWLERENGTPAAQEMAAGIGEAVGDLDRMIAQLLTVLVPPVPIEAASEQLKDVIPELHERLAPVLAARGIRWEPPGAAPQAVGDSEAFRAAALVVVRAGANLAGPGGWLSVDFQKDEHRYGLRLECGAAEDRPLSGYAESSMHELESRILAQGGSVEAECSGGDCAASVWLSAGSTP
jgi:K+-sensing histidine kinase KdpD